MSSKHQIFKRSHVAFLITRLQQGLNGPSEADCTEEIHAHETPMPMK